MHSSSLSSTTNSHSSCCNWTQEADLLTQILRNAFLQCQATSLIVEGFPKVGKSSAIQTAISRLKAEKLDFFVVKLSGLCHLEDKIALKEICKTISIDGGDEAISCSFDEMILKLEKLKKPILIWMQEFEKWAQSLKQSFLYGLFNACHTNQAMIVVVGETCRNNCIELLEKRVKSRFSHRIIRVEGHLELESFKEACLDGLSEKERQIPLKSQSFNTLCLKEWMISQNVGKIKKFLFKCQIMQQIEELSKFEEACSEFTQSANYLVQQASEMTDLSLGLLLTLRRIAASEGNSSFEAIYSIYRAFKLSSEGIAPSRDLCANAFEQLISTGFLVFCTKTTTPFGVGKRSQLVKDFMSISLAFPLACLDEHILPFANASLKRWALQE